MKLSAQFLLGMAALGLELGLVSGIIQKFFRPYKADFENRRMLTEEALALLQTAFTSKDGFDFNGPVHSYEAVSLSVDCRSQEELDELWEKLSAGGSPGRCGWLKDRYGLSWQIVPAALAKLLTGADRGRAQRVMAALMKMTKLDIRALEAAADAK